jgi:hypothetical protein
VVTEQEQIVAKRKYCLRHGAIDIGLGFATVIRERSGPYTVHGGSDQWSGVHLLDIVIGFS